MIIQEAHEGGAYLARDFNPDCAAEVETHYNDSRIRMGAMTSDDCCNESLRIIDNTWHCTRREGHDGVHVAGGRSHPGKVYARWVT